MEPEETKEVVESENKKFESIPLCAQCDEEQCCKFAYTNIDECLARYQDKF